jgi:hypothetical protein
MYMIELGIYHERPEIPPTVVVSGPYGDENINVFEILRDMKLEAETLLGAAVLDEQCFIRVFPRAE